MNQIEFNPRLYALPTTQLILGTRYNGKENYMALAWATRVNFKPPLIAIAVNNNHASHSAITEHQEFSLCMPSTEQVNITDYVGLVSGKNSDKSKLFTTRYGKLNHAPMIEECPLNLELKLYERVNLPTNTVFIGEIVGSWCREDLMTEGVPDIKKIKPFTLTMPDNRYWAFGDQVGNAWQDGKQLKK